MTTITDVLIPDIGGATDVDVIEVLVKVGDEINKDDSLLTLESDKASMEIPSPVAGVVSELLVKVGDTVSEGTLIMKVEVNGEAAVSESTAEPAAPEAPQAEPEAKAPEPQPVATEPTMHDVNIPDIGTTDEVDVIEVHVKPGDKVQAEDPLITLEGDKATMDIPAPYEGEIKEILVAVGAKVTEGHLIAKMLAMVAPTAVETVQAPKPEQPSAPKPAAAAASPAPVTAPSGKAHASPSVRRFARELGVDLSQVPATGRKGRVVKQDVQAYVKARLSGAAPSGTGLNIAPPPKVDFAKYGPVEEQKFNKIKRLTGVNLHRNWVMVPHVTTFDETDITDLEKFRKDHKKEAEKQGVRLTPLAFIMKACVSALEKFPQFNASLNANADGLIVKKYYHIGVAVDTPNGLVVPVIRDVDQKGVYELAKELGEISAKAREKGLTTKEMEGGTFTISSLGGIGGTAFTPIVNMPDVAILGVSRSSMKPIYQDGEFVPRLMLPVSVSYDHRVIDGAEGARFTRFLCECISDARNVIL